MNKLFVKEQAKLLWNTHLLVSGGFAIPANGADDLDDGDQEEGSDNAEDGVQTNLGELEEWAEIGAGIVVDGVAGVWKI